MGCFTFYFVQQAGPSSNNNNANNNNNNKNYNFNNNNNINTFFEPDANNSRVGRTVNFAKKGTLSKQLTVIYVFEFITNYQTDAQITPFRSINYTVVEPERARIALATLSRHGVFVIAFALLTI